MPIKVPSEPVVRWPPRSWRGSAPHQPKDASLLPRATPRKELSRDVGEFTVDWELPRHAGEGQ